MSVTKHQEVYDYFGRNNPKSSKTILDMKILKRFVIGRNEQLPEDLIAKGITTTGYAFLLDSLPLYVDTNLCFHFDISPGKILRNLRDYDDSFKKIGRKVERDDDGILRVYPLEPIPDAWGYCYGRFEEFISGPEGLLDYYFWMIENTSKFSFEVIAAFTQRDKRINDKVMTFEIYKDDYPFKHLWFGQMNKEPCIEDINNAILLGKSIEKYLKIPSKERRKRVREHPMYPQNIRSLLE